MEQYSSSMELCSGHFRTDPGSPSGDWRLINQIPRPRDSLNIIGDGTREVYLGYSIIHSVWDWLSFRKQQDNHIVMCSNESKKRLGRAWSCGQVMRTEDTALQPMTESWRWGSIILKQPQTVTVVAPWEYLLLWSSKLHLAYRVSTV